MFACVGVCKIPMGIGSACATGNIGGISSMGISQFISRYVDFLGGLSFMTAVSKLQTLQNTRKRKVNVVKHFHNGIETFCKSGVINIVFIRGFLPLLQTILQHSVQPTGFS